MKAPPGGRVAAKGAPGELWIGAAARPYIEDSNLEHVARFGIIDKNRTGADMDAKTLAGAAPVDRCVDRPGTAAIDVLRVLGPTEYAFGAGVAGDHPCMVVVRVVGQRLDRHQLARLHRQHRP